jgi:hypothetical protein
MAQQGFSSNRGNFNHKHLAFVDMALGRMAMAVEIALKTSSGMPVDTGNMKSQTRHFKNDNGNWRTEIDTAYAAYQEKGMRKDGTRIVKNYTTSGTGSGFFMRAIDIMTRQKESLIMESKRAVNL